MSRHRYARLRQADVAQGDREKYIQSEESTVTKKKTPKPAMTKAQKVERLKVQRKTNAENRRNSIVADGGKQLTLLLTKDQVAQLNKLQTANLAFEDGKLQLLGKDQSGKSKPALHIVTTLLSFAVAHTAKA